MDRTKKERSVAALHQSLLSGASLVVVTRHNGLTVAETTDLRRKLRAVGARFRVTKNRLARIALKGTSFENLDGLFKGPTAITYAKDAVAVAKVTLDYAKANEKLSVLGASLGGTQVIDRDGIEALTKLPPIEQLRAKLVGLIQSPAARIVGVLNRPAEKVVGVLAAPGRQLAQVLQAYAQKDEAK